MTLSGGFTTVATSVDYDPLSLTYGNLMGFISASDFQLVVTGSAGPAQLSVSSDSAWLIGLSPIWGDVGPP